MKILVTTVYESVDDEFLNWYVDMLRTKDTPINFDDLRSGHSCTFSSKDPTSKTEAKTTYRIEQ